MISEYLEGIKKSKCPCDCKFRDKNLPIIKIPPPKSPKIILISRDPTVDFIPIYEHSQRYKEEKRHRILFTAAIPLSLIEQIAKFLRKGNELTKEKEKNLFRLYDVAYWTHLHKCPTETENNIFKETRRKEEWKKATICPDAWLKGEIGTLIKSIQIIVCLGRDVERWMKNNISDDLIDKNRIIYLPHPSFRNNGVYSHKISEEREESIGKNIGLLLRALRD